MDSLSPPRFRFSLRTLIAVPFAICFLLGWWRMPFTITSHNGLCKSVVRRSWDGSLHFHGARTYFYDNGQKELEFQLFGHYKSTCVNTPKDSLRWDRDGRQISYR